MINLGLLLIGIMQMIYGLHGIIDYYIRDNKNKVENNSEKYAYIILCICGAILVRFSKILYIHFFQYYFQYYYYYNL